MEGNENKTLLDLERKLQTLFQYEKELAKETRNESHRTDIIEDELKNLQKKIGELEQKISLLDKRYDSNKTYKDFTAVEVYEMKKTYSWLELSKRLKCSISTVQRMVQRGKEEQRNG